MTTKYYHDPEADELVIASFDADGALSEVRRLTQSVEFEDETEEETEEEPEIVPEKKKPVVTPAVSKKSNKGIGRGKRASFDIEAMRSDIKDGMKTAVIADKYGVTLQTVYNTKSKMKAQQSGLSESEIEEIQQLRADGLTSSEIAADLGIEIKQVEAVQAKPYLAGKGDLSEQREPSTDEQIKKMVDVNCSKLEIVNAFPQLSLREIEEAIAWAQH